MDVNYRETLIAVADDCAVTTSVVPLARGGKKTLPLLQYEMLAGHPYEYTSAEVLFETSMRHQGVTEADLRSRRRELWDAFFRKPQPCLRSSALPKKYGWGLHCDAQGKVALCPRESAEYARLTAGAGRLRVLKALRSRRQG